MRVLILFISLITIVSCNKEQELTLLDRCIEANLEDRGEFDLLNKWIPYREAQNKIYTDDILKLLQTGELSSEEYSKLGMPLYESFRDSLTEDEQDVYSDVRYHDWENGIDYTEEEVKEQIKTLSSNFIKLHTDKAKDKAENICNMQGIY